MSTYMFITKIASHAVKELRLSVARMGLLILKFIIESILRTMERNLSRTRLRSALTVIEKPTLAKAR
jgi:hypothetical protein